MATLYTIVSFYFASNGVGRSLIFARKMAGSQEKVDQSRTESDSRQSPNSNTGNIGFSPAPSPNSLNSPMHIVEISQTTMDEATTKLALQTVETEVRSNVSEKELACKIKRAMDWNTPDRTWRCVVGKFKMYCEQEFECSIMFLVDDYRILIYRE